MQPDIYLITPALNSAATIDRTIWSILSQAGDFALHYHVQDGGSSDATMEKVRFWEEHARTLQETLRHEIHFSYDSSPDKGMYDAIVKGFAHFAMDGHSFMGWCNADDSLLPGALQSLAEISGDVPEARWLTGWASVYDNAGRCIRLNKKNAYPDAILRAGLADGRHWRFVQQESTFWKKSLWDEAGGLDRQLKLAGDWDLWRRFSRHAPLMHAQRQLGSFWRRPGQLSSDMTSYYAELNVIVSEEEQRGALHGLLKEAQSLLQWTILQKDEVSGQWASRPARVSRETRLLSRLGAMCPSERLREMLFARLKERLRDTAR